MVKQIVAALLLLSGAVGAQDAGNAGDAFYAAIRANDLARLQSMLKSGSHPNATDSLGGATPLMNAAAFGSVEAMKTLLDQGGDVNLKSTSGATALMWAVTDIEKVRFLLSRGADPKVATQRGRTALMLAARHDGGSAVVRQLISAGADAKGADATFSFLY